MPHVRKMVCVYGVDFRSKYKPGLIRRGRGLFANDNPASTLPGQQSFKRWAKVSVKVGVLYECLYLASAQSLRRRSALVAERVNVNSRHDCILYHVCVCE